MGVVHVQVPEDLKRIIDRQIAEGRASSEADFLVEAARLYAAQLDAKEEIEAVARRGIADMEAGRFVTISGPANTEALHQRVSDRLRALLASDTE